MNERFTKENVQKEGYYLIFTDGGWTTRRFVARFKYQGVFTISSFRKQLIKSIGTEEYFTKLEVEHKTPLEILKEKDPVWYEGMMQKARDKARI